MSSTKNGVCAECGTTGPIISTQEFYRGHWHEYAICPDCYFEIKDTNTIQPNVTGSTIISGAPEGKGE